MGSTIAEKALARASNQQTVTPGDHIICEVDLAMSTDIGTARVIERLETMEVTEVWDPSKIVCVMDHVAPAHRVEDANSNSVVREFVEEQNIDNFYDIGTGISHEVLPEKGHIRPGELVVGKDSHTVSHGVFGAASTGIGDTDMAYIYATGKNWFRVPETIKFVFSGTLPERVSSKDIVLNIAKEHGTGVARYRSIEFTGPTLADMSIDDRFTITNMAVELGAKFGFGPIDEKVLEYVDERTNAPYDPLRADADAEYEATYEMDVGQLDPQVAKPHKVGNVVPVGEVEGIDVDQIFIGSCTNGKYDDLQAAASVLEGHQVHPSSRLIITPASREIHLRAAQNGLIEIFDEAGATVTNPTCGACIGMGMGVLGDDEVCLAAQNRNFKGRMGSNSSEIYLSSPETAAATAINGHITDPREV